MRTLSIADARANLFELVRSAAVAHERFAVTRDGRPEAVLLGADDYDALVETLAILSDPDAVGEIRAGIRDLADGDTSSAAEVRRAWADRNER